MSDSTLVQIPFIGSLKQKTAEEHLDPSGAFVSILNGVYDADGSVAKRFGIGALNNQATGNSKLAAPTTGINATSWSRSALTLFSQGAVYTYDKANQGTVGVSNLPAVYPIRRPVPARSGTVTAPISVDFPYGTGTRRLAMFMQKNANGLYSIVATVFDADTGDVYLEPTAIYNATGGGTTFAIPMAAFYQPNAAAGAQVLLFFGDENTNVKGLTFNQATNGFSAITTLYNVSGLGAFGDIVPFIGDAAGGFVAFFPTSATNVRINYYTNLTTIAHTTNQAFTGALQLGMYAFATSGASEHGWFAYATLATTTITFDLMQTSGDGLFTVQAGPTTITTAPSTPFPFFSGLTRVDAGDVHVGIAIPYAPAANSVSTVSMTWYRYSTGIVLASTSVAPPGFYPAARPFTVNGQVYQPTYLSLYDQATPTPANVQSLQYTLYLLTLFEGKGFVPIATVAPRQISMGGFLGLFLFSGAQLPYSYAASNSATRFATGISINGSAVSYQRGAVPTSWLADFFFDAQHIQNLYQANELGNALHISGGVPFVCDASLAFEDNFFYYPEFSYVTGTGAAGGSYDYAVVYTYTDAAGNIHRSAPFFTASTTLSTRNLHIFAAAGSWREISAPGNVYAEIYRTVLNGSTFYYIDRICVSGTGSSYITWPASGSDGVSDANAQLATLLYTTGGVLDNVNPPAALIQISHQNRIAIVDETLRNVWFSKKYVAGEAPGFNEALIVAFPENGDITGLGSMDDKFVVFKKNTIWIQTGDGPAQTGQNSDWSIPVRVASDVGATSNKSIVLMPLGLMFMTESGIQILTRDLQVQNIGVDVSNLTTQFPIVVSATLVPDIQHVRFVCQNATRTASIVLVYDYLFNRWMQHQYNAFTASVAGATLSNGQYSFITSDGNIWQEHLSTDANPYLDDASVGVHKFVPTSIKSAWFSLQNLQGYQRARRVILSGTQAEPAVMTISLAVNYDETIQQQFSWSRLPDGTATQLQMHVGSRLNKERALQITLSDDATSIGAFTTGQGFRYTGLAIELQPIGTYNRKISAGGRA